MQALQHSGLHHRHQCERSQTVFFRSTTNALAYAIDIYRLGYTKVMANSGRRGAEALTIAEISRFLVQVLLLL